MIGPCPRLEQGRLDQKSYPTDLEPLIVRLIVISSINLAERRGLEPQPISQSTRLAGGACPMTVYFP